jgi:hypothetical protein
MTPLSSVILADIKGFLSDAEMSQFDKMAVAPQQSETILIIHSIELSSPG